MATTESDLCQVSECVRTLKSSSRQVNIVGKRLTHVLLDFSLLSNIEVLNLKNNRLSWLPGEMHLLGAVRQFDLSNNSFSTIPPPVLRLGTLQRFLIFNNKIEFVADDCFDPRNSSLGRLQVLNLNGNRLQSVPTSLKFLTALKRLSRNRISFLPGEIGDLVNLEELHLGFNGIAHLPERITQLTRIRKLLIPRNRLEHLPPRLDALTRLTHLDVAGNNLSSLPSSIAPLRLTEFHCEMNCFQTKRKLVPIDSVFPVPPLQELAMRRLLRRPPLNPKILSAAAKARPCFVCRQPVVDWHVDCIYTVGSIPFLAEVCSKQCYLRSDVTLYSVLK